MDESGTIQVRHIAGEQFEISPRQHRFRIDQPVPDGGEDSAPTPVELFVSSLAACVGVYARRFLVRHDLATEGLSVEADYSISTRPVRVEEIAIRLHSPDGVPDAKLPALLAVASHCTVHNTLQSLPKISIDLVPAKNALVV